MLHRYAGLIVALVTLLTWVGQPVSAQQPEIRAPASPDEIASLVADLSDPSFEKRTYATRRLCAIGPAARTQLEAAAQGESFEAARRARQVLEQIDQLLFAGVKVQLEVDRPEIRWDEPAILSIHLYNESLWPATVPFVLQRAASSEANSGEELALLGDFIDAAEFLRVQDSKGRAVEPWIDDLGVDTTLSEMLAEKVRTPPRTSLAPGERATVRLDSINRSWGRFRLLDREAYSIRLSYVPEWNDPILDEAMVGRAKSNEVAVMVTTPAPPVISRNGPEALLEVSQEGAELVARLTNRRDVPMRVNMNLGAAAPFAQVTWVCVQADRSRDVPAADARGATWKNFAAESLVVLEPGRAVELARTDVAKLRASIGLHADPPVGPWNVSLGYMNFCSRAWQSRERKNLERNEGIPEGLRNPLPRRIITGRYSSEPIAVQFQD